MVSCMCQRCFVCSFIGWFTLLASLKISQPALTIARQRIMCDVIPVWCHASVGISRHHVSVCPSHTCIVAKLLNIGSRKQCHVIAQRLVFWSQQSLVSDPHSPWNLHSVTHPLRTPWFHQYPLIAPQMWRLVRKSSISTNRKSTTRFPTSHRWTMYVTPKSPKRWHKTRFCCCFPSKIQLLSNEVCYKVSLCENFQQQSFSYISSIIIIIIITVFV